MEFVGIGNGNDVRFQSVSGLNIEYDTESFKEGGENRFEHKLPVRTKYGDVSLKRGMLINSDVLKWCLDAFENREFRPSKVNVILLNEQHEPLKRWELVDAWPKKWNVSDLNAQENSVVIETLDLSYKYFKVK